MLERLEIHPLLDEADAPEGAAPPDGQGNEPDDQQPTPGKTFSQDEVNALIAREKKRAAERAKAEAREEAKRAEETALEKAQREKAEAEAKIAEAEARATQAARRADLAGKVANVQAAVKLLEDNHLNEDGSVNVEAFLKDHPYMASSSTPSPSGGSGGTPPKRTDASKLSDDEYFRQRLKDPQ